MALEQKLALKLAQKLVMTPSLQQAIKLLQMTRVELRQVVTEELEANPLLEEVESVEEEPAEEREEESAPEPESEAEEPGAAAEEKPIGDELDHREALDDVDLDAYFRNEWEGSNAPRMHEQREAPPLENTLTREPDLYDHLLFQLHMSDAGPREREIAELIIGNLDDDGFLTITVDEILEATPERPGDRPFRREEVEQVLARVRGFDPPGIACFTVQESLLTQLVQAAGEANGQDALAHKLVAEHWDALLRRQFPAIAKDLDIPLADLEPVIDRIRALQTRPGRGWGRDETHYVEPEVAIVKVGDDYAIQLNDDGLPRLRISRAYRRMLRRAQTDQDQTDTRQFLKEKMRAAAWLIKSLDQRQRTIYKVTESILRQQRDFFDHGIDHLRPMVLRDVAEDIGMHESTVSRVVSNKYMETPRGVFPLKYFFHSGLDRAYGGDISSLTVKKRIRELIESEDAKHPFSDSALARALKREGISIARRTVAKYRDEMKIPSSTDRKQIF
ncbi:MAG: RNA polymerase factor sigma-54 [Thermoanaerobaculia bacterium]